MPGLPLTWASEEFELLPQRALLWKRKETLIIADVHLGKPAAFRAWGLPVPDGSTTATLAVLAQLIEESGVKRLLILGDLLHARAGRDPRTLEVVEQWRAQYASIEMTLVRGNHDASAGDPPPSWNVHCCDGPLVFGNLAMVHDPAHAPRSARFFIAGHIHPVISLADDDGTSLRLPCFCFGRRRALLPAFGAFTGGGRMTIEPGDRVFPAGDGHVMEAPVPQPMPSK